MANLMDLVRELKALNARKKAGEALSAAEEARRKELKGFLRSTLEAQGGGGSMEENSGVSEPPQRSSSAPKEVPLARPAPSSSMPQARPSRSSAPTAAAPRPTTATTTTKSPAPRPVSTPSTTSKALEDEALPELPKPKQSSGNTIPPASSSAPKPYVPRKDAFAIDAGLAGALIDNAMSSEAVAKVDPFAGRKAHASTAEVQDAEARAEAALKAQKKRERATTPDEVEAQLRESEGGYTPAADSFVLEQYYGDFVSEGFALAGMEEASHLKPVDPREIEVAKLDAAGGPGSGSTSVAVPQGLAFIDDFPALYARRVLPPADDDVSIDSNDPNLLIPGKRKVTVHLLNGEKKQGAIRSLRRGELGFKLEPIGSGQTEELSITQVKAVFIHLQPNAQPSGAAGRSLTATFRDGRSVQGVSDDYQPGAPIFTLVPQQGRGQFERIIVNGAAVASVQ